MSARHHRSLAKIKPRPSTIYCSQGRAVLATDLDGLIGDFPRHGLFVRETRVLSRYRYFVEGKGPANRGCIECGATFVARILHLPASRP